MLSLHEIVKGRYTLIEPLAYYVTNQDVSWHVEQCHLTPQSKLPPATSCVDHHWKLHHPSLQLHVLMQGILPLTS